MYIKNNVKYDPKCLCVDKKYCKEYCIDYDVCLRFKNLKDKEKK